MIGLCVLQQAGNDAYWKYHSAVFGKQKEIEAEKAPDQLLDIAKDAGADRAKVETCLKEETTKPIVDATLAEAEAIVSAFSLPENTGKGVIALDGRMVERLHLAEAERLVALAAAIRA